MGKRIYLICIVSAAALALICMVLLMNRSNRPAMKWAESLKVNDISKIELIVTPSSKQEQYRLFEEREFAGIVDLINESRGRYVSNPESLAGGAMTFYITLKDGGTHRVGNNGNTYLTIDDDNYDAGYQWLSTRWKEYRRGNAMVPEWACSPKGRFHDVA